MSTNAKTNVEFITHLMEYSRTGAIMQLFVIGALDVYSRATIANPPKEIMNGSINADAWLAAAKEVDAALRDRGLIAEQEHADSTGTTDTRD